MKVENNILIHPEMQEHCCSFKRLSVHDSSTSPRGDCVSQYERQDGTPVHWLISTKKATEREGKETLDVVGERWDVGVNQKLLIFCDCPTHHGFMDWWWCKVQEMCSLHTFGPFAPAEHCLNTTAHLGSIADRVHP